MNISKTLAKLIKDSADLRENSYDHAAAEMAIECSRIAREREPDNLYVGVIEFNKFYTMTLAQACENVCNDAGQPELSNLIYYMLAGAWNDVLDWSREILKDDNEQASDGSTN